MPQISHNELLNTVEKAFEAMGFRAGERTEGAEAIAWLERHGLGGVVELTKALEHMPREAKGRLVERYRKGGLRVFSADGQSILNAGGAAVDAVLSMAQHHALATVRIESCHNRALIAGFLTRAAYRNTGVLACWSNQHQSRLHLAWQNGADRFPYLRIQARPRAATADQSLTLIASRALDLQPSLSPDTDTSRLIQVVDLETMQQAERRTLIEGLALSEYTWDRLKRIATGVLVDDGTN